MFGISLLLGGGALSCSSQVVDAVESGALCPEGGSDVDSDGDNVPDCVDSCKNDYKKSAGSGLCGCGFADPEAGSDVPTCMDLVAVLAHRYAFNGTGTDVIDSATGGDADGVVLNTELSGGGTLVLAGGMSDQYVDLLSNRLISSSETGSITLEAWLRWNGGGNWQRIFDFGNNDGPQEGEQGMSGNAYLFLTPRGQLGKLRVAYKRPGGSEYEVILDAPITLPSGVDTHVAVVIDAMLKRMSLYVDGRLQDGIAYFRNVGAPATTEMRGVYDWSEPVTTSDGEMVNPPAIDLSVIDDINNWLGRSQFKADSELDATLDEFRIYSSALTPELIELSHSAGPNAEFLQ
jgi:hypothetical protein